MRAAPAFAVCVALLLVSAAARADERVAYQPMRFAERDGQLVVSTSIGALFDRAAVAKLASGFPTTVVVRLYVYRKDRELPVSFVLASHRVVYDLWEERYTLRSDGPRGQRTLHIADRDQVVAAISELDRFPIAPLERIDIGPHHFLAMVVELNPISEELLAEMRRWLTRPAGEARLDTSSSFFGSFVSVFVNPKLQEAERVLELRSQPFYRVPR